jgi:hypothetical protein
MGIISAIAIPMSGNAIKFYRLAGDARTISNTFSVAKLRAASTFNRARIKADLSAGTYGIQIWVPEGPGGVPAATWADDGGQISLSSGVTWGFGSIATAPSTLAPIDQAPQCTTGAGDAISHTACVVFNSRGTPIDGTGSPIGGDALYISDGTAVFGVTVAASGLIGTWQSPPHSAQWTKQ